MLTRMYQFFRPRYEPETGGGKGGGNTPPAATPPGGDPAAAYQRLLERTNNDATALSRQLYDENYRYREQIRELQGRLPAEGAVVLTAEQAQQWTAYQGLGALADIQAGLQARDTATQELTTLKRGNLLRDVAEALNLNADGRQVLTTIGGDREFVIKDETVNGKAVRAVYIKDGDKETAFKAYAETNWRAFLPALTSQAEQRPAIGTPRTQPQGGQGTPPQEQPRRPATRL